MMNPAVTPIKSSTQSFLEIEDIKDGLVILRDGSVVLIISTTATNFGLLSEKEQDAVIYAYGALLNSLNFPIQILIRSKRKDITAYLNLLKRQEEKTSAKKLRQRIHEYRGFIESTVQVNNVLEKKFYVIIPMSFLELGIGKTVGSKLKKQKGLPFPKEYILEKARINIFPKRDHLFRLLRRLGLRSRQLNTQELVQLFFEIYNPSIQGQLLSNTEEYDVPLVKPAANFMTTPPPELNSEGPVIPLAPDQPAPASAATIPAAPQPQPKPTTPLPNKKPPSPPSPKPAPPLKPTKIRGQNPQAEIDQLVDEAIVPQTSVASPPPSSQGNKPKPVINQPVEIFEARKAKKAT